MEKDRTVNPHPAAELYVPLEGDLGLKTARSVCDILRQAVDRSDAIVIDARNAIGIDISIVQLLIAARKSAERQGKRVTIMAGSAGPLQTTVREAGLTQELTMQAG